LLEDFSIKREMLKIVNEFHEEKSVVALLINRYKSDIVYPCPQYPPSRIFSKKL